MKIDNDLALKICNTYIKEAGKNLPDVAGLSDAIETIVSEYEELKKMSTPRDVNYEGDGYADGEMVYDTARCPNCDHLFEECSGEFDFDYCPNCGQALRWNNG